MSPDQFWAKVQKTDGGCWLWGGTRDRLGYGRIVMRLNGVRVQLAHRAAFILTHGYHPPALDHMCRTPSCVNPAHLDPCGQAENMRKTRKERCSRGHLLAETRVVCSDGKARCLLCREALKRAWARRNPERVLASQARHRARQKAAA